jgi:hypothetical protein
MMRPIGVTVAALLIRMSKPGAQTSASLARSVMSQITPRASGAAASVSASEPALRAVKVTVAPKSSRARQVARPMPPAPPVTRAVRPERGWDIGASC